MAEQRKGLDPVVKYGIASGLITGTLWTVVAGTLWQWVPIAGAVTAIYYVEKIFIAVGKDQKGGKP